MSEERGERQVFLANHFRSWLLGPEGRAEWGRLFDAGWGALLATRLDVLLPRAAVDRLLKDSLTKERIVELVRPAAGAGLSEVLLDLAADRAPLSRWVAAPAVARIEEVAGRPGLVEPEWIRALFQEKAVEEVLADTLYSAMREFSTILPRLFGSLLSGSRLGILSGAAGIGVRIAEEVERRLEPEIKAFLKSGTQRALAHASDYAVAHLDDPVSRQLRRNFVRFALGRSASQHVAPVDAEVAREVEEIAVEIAEGLAQDPAFFERISRAVDGLFVRWGPLSLKEALARAGGPATPPLEHWAELTWPGITRVAEAAGIWDRLAEVALAGLALLDAKEPPGD